ncbi:hypothetical protein [Streptomyces sp. SLBN-8D4]|uniref:hypothetical protein n=1 Tax=Streptomyces sp. SLBN-8D4 TaxID=3377728 RepID=UPI003C7DD6F1
MGLKQGTVEPAAVHGGEFAQLRWRLVQGVLGEAVHARPAQTYGIGHQALVEAQLLVGRGFEPVLRSVAGTGRGVTREESREVGPNGECGQHRDRAHKETGENPRLPDVDLRKAGGLKRKSASLSSQGIDREPADGGSGAVKNWRVGLVLPGVRGAFGRRAWDARIAGTAAQKVPPP